MLEGRLLFAYASAGRWHDVERMRARLREPGGDRTGGVLPAFADYVRGEPEPVLRLLGTRAGLRRWFDTLWPTANGTGCSPLTDPLWADARYRAAMAGLGIGPCRQARPWPFPARASGKVRPRPLRQALRS